MNFDIEEPKERLVLKLARGIHGDIRLTCNGETIMMFGNGKYYLSSVSDLVGIEYDSDGCIKKGKKI